MEGVKVDYGDSEVYSEGDMEEAIGVILEEFRTWEGCELHKIAYSSDDSNNSESIAWLNDLVEGEGLEGDFTECIMFTSEFHSPKEDSGAWNPDEEYTGYEWWLARTDGGEWNLVAWGY
ncbi:MAG: hypothetical protein Q4B70_07820 [Lachnospiraceae bacterium]|nr:hypothetical protein [Lachnospiraceae bacterium]